MPIFPFLAFSQGSLENDINQDFQDAIDVIQRHSQIRHCDNGTTIYNINTNVEKNLIYYAIVLSINYYHDYYYSFSSNYLFQKINTMRIWKVNSPL